MDTTKRLRHDISAKDNIRYKGQYSIKKTNIICHKHEKGENR